MKKIVSMLTALMLVATIGVAMAEVYSVQESFESFDLKVTIPEGMQVTQEERDGWVDIEFSDGKENSTRYELHITPTEEYTGLSYKDLSEEDKGWVRQAVLYSFFEPEQEEFTTPSGNIALFTRETSAAGQFASIDTIYKGYFFSLYCARDDYSALTDDEIAMMHQIIEGTEIEQLKEPEMPSEEMLAEAEAEATNILQ